MDDPNVGQADGDFDGLGDACDPEFNNTFLSFDSEAGDFIGAGMQFTFTLADGTITASRNFDNGVRIDFRGGACPGCSTSRRRTASRWSQAPTRTRGASRCILTPAPGSG